MTPIPDPPRPGLLLLAPVNPDGMERLRAHFELIDARTEALREQAVTGQAGRITVALTIGSIGLRAEEIARLPHLQLIAALGAGYENIDLEAARARGIAVVNGAGSNAACVADQAFALLLAVVRQVPVFDRAVRQGHYRDTLPEPTQFSGKRLGILGLGAIGRELARRGESFALAIGYHSRQRKDGVEYAYFEAPLALAEWADYLVVALPGGATTQHMVDADVLKALGPQGYLVNIARGSVVDTAALAAALADGGVAGAGLDVYEGEPAPPATLIDSPRVVLSPHVGGSSPEAREAAITLFLDNAKRHFSGRDLKTPV